MKDANESEPSFFRLDQKLPEINERVIVICRNSRRYGYLDKDGTWRSHYSNEKLDDVIGWAP